MSKYRIKLDGKTYEMEIEAVGAGNIAPAASSKTAAPAPASSAPVSKPSQVSVAEGQGAVISPMPGTVVKVLVKEGDEVKAGQPVLVLEAMKMENEITAEKDGKIVKIAVAEGQAVAKDEVLVVVE